MAASGVKVLTTVDGFERPVFGVFANDNVPRFRDGNAWPDSIPMTSHVPEIHMGEESGHAPVNARTLWDSGVILGYCTDTGYDPLAGLDHELKILNVMFSMKDLVKMMGPNTASHQNGEAKLRSLRQTGRHDFAGRGSAGGLLELAENESGDQRRGESRG